MCWNHSDGFWIHYNAAKRETVRHFGDTLFEDPFQILVSIFELNLIHESHQMHCFTKPETSCLIHTALHFFLCRACVLVWFVSLSHFLWQAYLCCTQLQSCKGKGEAGSLVSFHVARKRLKQGCPSRLKARSKPAFCLQKNADSSSTHRQHMFLTRKVLTSIESYRPKNAILPSLSLPSYPVRQTVDY